MPECAFVILESRPPKKERDVTYSVVPPVKAPCSFTIMVNGQPAIVGADIDDLHISGIQGTGGVTVRPLSEPPRGSISIKVQCKGEQPCGPTTETFQISPQATRAMWIEVLLTISLPITLILLLVLAFGLIIALFWLFVLGDKGPLLRILRYLRELWRRLPKWLRRLLRARII